MIKDRRITYDRICDIMYEVEDGIANEINIDIETLFDVLYILNEKREQMEEKDGDADKIVINIDKKALDDAMLNAYDEDDEEDRNDGFFLATKIADLVDHIVDIVKDEEEGRAFSMIGTTVQTILEAIANAHINGEIYKETKESSEYAIKLAKAMAHIMSVDEPEFNDGEEEDNE